MSNDDDSKLSPFMDPQHSDDLIALADHDGRENMAAKFRTAEWIAGQSSVTLTILLAGVGGSLAYAAKVFEPGAASPLAIAAAALCAYLTLLAGLLVWRCLMLDPFPAQTNEPNQWLYSPGMGLSELRRRALKNLQDRISEAREANEHKASALNRIRLAAAASPLLFALVAWGVASTRPLEQVSVRARGQAAASPGAPGQVGASAAARGPAGSGQ